MTVSVLVRCLTDHERDWIGDAACGGSDPDLWFPHRGERVALRAAQRVCAGCPVKAECLDYAVTNDEHWGVWGGLSETDRMRMRKLAL